MTVVSTRHHKRAGLVATATGAAMLCLVSAEAMAQFGTIFGDPQPPRPPASVPGGREPVGREPTGREQYGRESSPFPQPYGEPPARRQPYPQQQQGPDGYPEQLPPGPPPAARRSPAPIQSEPLPPAEGTTQPPSAQQPSPNQQGGLPPGQRQPRGTPQPADTGPQPGDEVVTAPPTQKIPNQTAVFAGLDKITGRIISFDVAIGETVQFGALQVLPRACYTRPPTEAAATDAFVEVSEVTLQGEVRRIFSGWMFAASPGLNAVEHPIYDVWLTDCKSPTVKVAEDPAPMPKAGSDAPKPAASQQPAPRQQQPRQRQQRQDNNSAFPAPIR